MYISLVISCYVNLLSIYISFLAGQIGQIGLIWHKLITKHVNTVSIAYAPCLEFLSCMWGFPLISHCPVTNHQIHITYSILSIAVRTAQCRSIPIDSTWQKGDFAW